MSGSYQFALNGSEVWGYVVELADGFRLRLDLSDWERVGLTPGRRVPLRLPGNPDAWFYITHATEVPPFVWLVLERRVKAAG